MVPQNYRFQSNNRNNTFDQNRRSYQEFRRNLIHSGQSRMQVDENYQQNKEYKEDVYNENENFPMQASDQLHT